MGKKRNGDGFVEPMVEEPEELRLVRVVGGGDPDPLRRYVRTRPYEATLLTLAAGMTLGLLIGLRR